jgi:CubicO group peptidase (beta-lactamase class C family)
VTPTDRAMSATLDPLPPAAKPRRPRAVGRGRLPCVVLCGLGLLAAWTPARAGALDSAKLAAMDTALAAAIAARTTPGAVLWVERDGQVHRRAFGNLTYAADAPPVTEDTVYDAASLTKVVVTATAVLQLTERGQLELDAPVARWLPDFARHGKEAVTVRQLLTHVSGLRPDLDLQPAWDGYATGVALATEEKLRQAPGAAFVYSDIGFIVLGELVRVADGRPLDVYAAEEILAPLGMRASGFRPAESGRARIAPTEVVAGRALQGVVHDPTTRMMGGVAGHAGLFTATGDLARFARMILEGGALEGTRVLRPETVAEMNRAQHALAERRGLGWDIDTRFSSPRGRWFSVGRSFGHTGYTGTSLWIDPESRTFWILLTNRVHPDDKTSLTALRRELGTLAAEAAGLGGETR